MSVDDRTNIAGELAEILAKMDSVRFPVAGRLLYDEPSKTAKRSLDLAQISDIEEKLVVRGFHRFFEEHHQRDAPTAPPTSSLYELLNMHIDARFQHKRADGHEIPGPELLKSQAMLQDMKDMGWFASDDGNSAYSIINHAQLSPFGIMVEQARMPRDILVGISAVSCNGNTLAAYHQSSQGDLQHGCSTGRMEIRSLSISESSTVGLRSLVRFGSTKTMIAT